MVNLTLKTNEKFNREKRESGFLGDLFRVARANMDDGFKIQLELIKPYLTLAFDGEKRCLEKFCV